MKKTQTVKKRPRVIAHTRRHAKTWLIPHEANHYRPHLIRWYGLLLVAIMVISLQLGYHYATYGKVLGVSVAVTADEIARQTNEKRVAMGMPTFMRSDVLDQAARKKAGDILARQYWAHVAPDGTTPWTFLEDSGYMYIAAGENLARDFSSSSAVVTGWMNSPEHRKNIVDTRFRDIGIAVVDGNLNGRPTSIIVAYYGTTQAGTYSTEVTFMQRMQGLLRRINPSLMTSLLLLFVTIVVALLTHHYRRHLPRSLGARSRHHAIVKALSVYVAVIVVIWIATSGVV